MLHVNDDFLGLVRLLSVYSLGGVSSVPEVSGFVSEFSIAIVELTDGPEDLQGIVLDEACLLCLSGLVGVFRISLDSAGSYNV